MTPATLDLLARLDAAEWFANVGRPLPADADVLAVESWERAVEFGTSDDWGNYLLEQHNLLTMFLDETDRPRYGRWGDVLAEVQSRTDPLVARKLAPLLANRPSLPDAFDGWVKWAIVGACMQHEHTDARPIGFYAELAEWYVRGRFPCGWGNRGSGGRLELARVGDDVPSDPGEVVGRALHYPFLEPPIRLPAGRLLVF